MRTEKEELKVESLEEEVESLKKDLFKLFESFIPPKEVRQEIVRNLYTIELSFLKILKAVLDYQVESLEKKTAGKVSKKAKRIKVE